MQRLELSCQPPQALHLTLTFQWQWGVALGYDG